MAGYAIPPTPAGRVAGERVIIGAVTVMYPDIVCVPIPSILVTVSLMEYVPADENLTDGLDGSGTPDPKTVQLMPSGLYCHK